MPDALRFECVTERGEVVYGRPLSPFVRRGILERALELYPAPDVTPFIGDVDTEAGLDEAHSLELAKQAAYASDGYRRAAQEVDNNRWHYIYAATLQAGAVVDTPEGQTATIARFADEVARVREIVPDPISDDWLATVMYGLVVTYGDAGKVYAAAFQRISDEAMQAAVKFFRVPV